VSTRDEFEDQRRIASLERQLAEEKERSLEISTGLLADLTAIMAECDRAQQAVLEYLQAVGPVISELRKKLGLKPVGGLLLRQKRLRKKAGLG